MRFKSYTDLPTIFVQISLKFFLITLNKSQSNLKKWHILLILYCENESRYLVFLYLTCGLKVTPNIVEYTFLRSSNHLYTFYHHLYTNIHITKVPKLHLQSTTLMENTRTYNLPHSWRTREPTIYHTHGEYANLRILHECGRL
jgi:hypothetical protein